MHSFFEQETGLTVGNRELCVCGACDLSIRQALKARDHGGLRWLKSKRVCCAPSCGSVDFEVHVHRHGFSWEDVCKSISIASVSSPVDRLLCSKHYQQVYKMLNVVSKVCVCCGVKRRHEHSATSSDKRIGTVFHRTKADTQCLLSHSLYDNSSCAPISQDCDTSLLNTKVHEII